VPTIDESGLPGYEITTWWGIAAPSGTPENIIAKVNRDIIAVMALADVKELFASQGAETRTGTPQEFARYIVEQIEFYGRIINDAGITPE
jgi:tripartite-type tricarboxylate transporter receptor subunit TctC